MARSHNPWPRDKDAPLINSGVALHHVTSTGHVDHYLVTESFVVDYHPLFYGNRGYRPTYPISKPPVSPLAVGGHMGGTGDGTAWHDRAKPGWREKTND